MKTILLTRHGKTIEADGEMADFDRYLTKRGKQDPVFVARELIDLNIIPDKIISSSAVRAAQTAEIFASRFDVSKSNLHLLDFLYGYYSTEKLIEYLGQSASKSNTVQIVGHNPKMEELGADLTGSVYRRLPTTGTMVLEFDVKKWEHIMEGSGTMLHYITAKSLRE